MSANRVAVVALLLMTVPLAGCFGDDNGEQGVTIVWADQPEDARTGEEIEMSWQLSGPEGEIPHTAVHYGDTSVDDPENPGDYGNTAGLTEPADVPGTYTATVTFGEAGTYYFRGHAFINDAGDSIWTSEVSVTVSQGASVDTPVVVSVSDHTEEGQTGESLTVNWTLDGVPGQIEHTGFHWANSSVEDPQSPADYGKSSGVQEPAEVPGHYNATFDVSEPGTYHGRAHAIADGEHYWSDEVTFEVSGASMGDGAGENHTIEMQDIPISFAPDNLTVQPGDTITWVNVGNLVHTATADDESLFDSGDVAPGGNFTWKVPADLEPGTYHYICIYHNGAGMNGDIVVEAPSEG